MDTPGAGIRGDLLWDLLGSHRARGEPDRRAPRFRPHRLPLRRRWLEVPVDRDLDQAARASGGRRGVHAVVAASRRASERPIGVFDSGVGGLTAVRALEELLPQKHLVYFGDTARAPYGPRTVAEVRRFAVQIMDLMATQDVKMFVIACNAMTAAAYEAARDHYELPVIGV